MSVELKIKKRELNIQRDLGLYGWAKWQIILGPFEEPLWKSILPFHQASTQSRFDSLGSEQRVSRMPYLPTSARLGRMVIWIERFPTPVV